MPDRQSAVKPITDTPTQPAVTRSKHADTTLLVADTPNIPAESTLTHGHIASPQAADMLRTTALMEDETAEELGTDADRDSDASVQVQITCPEITANDYRTDSEFCDMYNYLQTGELTNNDKTDQLTLLMADMYCIRRKEI